MTDKETKNWREGTPKWKIEAIEKELLTAHLSWPKEAMPTPAPFRWGDYDRQIGSEPVPGTYWTENSYARRVEKVVLTYQENTHWGLTTNYWHFNGSTIVTRGPLYYTERDAWLAVLWGVCFRQAKTLQDIRRNGKIDL